MSLIAMGSAANSSTTTASLLPQQSQSQRQRQRQQQQQQPRSRSTMVGTIITPRGSPDPCPEPDHSLFVLTIDYDTTHMDYVWALQDSNGTNYFPFRSPYRDAYQEYQEGREIFRLSDCLPTYQCYTFVMMETLEFEDPLRSLSYGLSFGGVLVREYNVIQGSPEHTNFGFSKSSSSDGRHIVPREHDPTDKALCKPSLCATGSATDDGDGDTDTDTSLIEIILAPNIHDDFFAARSNDPNENAWNMTLTVTNVDDDTLYARWSLNSIQLRPNNVVFWCEFLRVCVPRLACVKVTTEYDHGDDVTFEVFQKITLDGDVYRDNVVFVGDSDETDIIGNNVDVGRTTSTSTSVQRRRLETTYLGKDACTATQVCGTGITDTIRANGFHGNQSQSHNNHSQHDHDATIHDARTVTLLQMVFSPKQTLLSSDPWYIDRGDGTPSSTDVSGDYFGWTRYYDATATYVNLLCIPTAETKTAKSSSLSLNMNIPSFDYQENVEEFCTVLGISDDCAILELKLDNVSVLDQLRYADDNLPPHVLFVGSSCHNITRYRIGLHALKHLPTVDLFTICFIAVFVCALRARKRTHNEYGYHELD